MLRAKVGFDTKLETRPTKSGGSFTNQTVWVFQPDAEYPIKIVIVIPLIVAESGGYLPGEYLMDLDSMFDQGRFKSPDLGFQMLLIPFSPEVYARKISLLQFQLEAQREAYAKFSESSSLRKLTDLQNLGNATASEKTPPSKTLFEKKAA
jgi:hypothetical protein